MAPYIPQYESPQQKAARRADLKARLFWIAVTIPVLFALLVFSYSDQAPAFLRDGVRALDASLGYPILTVLAWIVR